jgi:hypothetical protein
MSSLYHLPINPVAKAIFYNFCVVLLLVVIFVVIK